MKPNLLRSFHRFALPAVLLSAAAYGALFFALRLRCRSGVFKTDPLFFWAVFFAVHFLVLVGVLLVVHRRLERTADYAHRLAEGKQPPALTDIGEPFHGLVSGIRQIAMTVEDKVQAAREAKNRIWAILESLAEGVLVVDTDQKVVLVNSALARSFGFEKEAVVGRYFWEVFRDPDINRMIEESLDRRVALKKEHSLLMSAAVFEIQVSPVFGHDDFLGAAAVFHDVSRLKELERLRVDFVANVSHELKTPLTSILGFIETLKDGAIEDAGHRMKFLNIIELHAKKLHTLIEDLLWLSEMESARTLPAKSDVDLENMVDRILDLFNDQIREKKIRIEKQFSSKPFVVRAEAKSFERALSNLVDNAIKYNKAGGAIKIRASGAAGEVSVEITDTGIGISEADLPRIFERFYRSEKSRSRESGGTGLGLSIAKHIVERHGGTIRVMSVPAKGSAFTVVLPSGN